MKQVMSMILVIAGMANLNAYAIDGFSMDLGYGEESAVHIGTSAKWNWDSKWFTAGNWSVGGHWEVGAAHWNGKSGKHSNGSITLVGITPVFRLMRHQPLFNGMMPFFEGAVGFHMMSDNKIGDADLGGNFIFGTHIAAGVPFSSRRQYELSVRLQHFSNAGIYNGGNNGMDFVQLRFSYNFE